VEAVVIAAGEGTRLRPLTERWAKPVLPIDGRPVLARLLRELALASVQRVWLVVGHLAGQVEALAGDGAAWGLELHTVRQHEQLGSADAMLRALDAGAAPPCLLSAADTVYEDGTLRNVARCFVESDAAGAIAVRTQPGRPAATRVRVERGLVTRVPDPRATSDVTAAPLMVLGPRVADEVEVVCRPPYEPPYELAAAFQRVIDAGEPIAALEIGATRDLTDPLDLVWENFPYLRGLR
jgi:NDP-sugar pyrophosphorylase family protein